MRRCRRGQSRRRAHSCGSAFETTDYIPRIWRLSCRGMARITSPPPLPPRAVDGHKGLFGRVLVVGGNDGMIGAPALAGRAALKMGAGLVEIAVPRSILAAALM